MARLLLALLLVSVHALPAAAQADALQRAQALFDDAQRDIASGNFDGAADKFKAAYEARELPDLLYNVGTAYYLKGKKQSDPAAYALAVEYYKKYLVVMPKAQDKGEVDKAIGIIAKEIERLKGATPEAPPPPSEEVQKLEQKTRSLVVIETEPQGANIYLDDKKNGVFAQTPWSGSLDGTHRVIIEKRGHKSKESTLSPDPNRLVVLQVVLSEEDYLGWLEIRSNVPGASIFLDDKAAGAIGKTPFSGNLKPGKHTVWISADGYDETQHEVEIIAGETHEIVSNLTGTPVGYLDIRGTGLDGARVYVDREMVCERAPCRKPVAEGTHTIAVARDGYKTYRTRIDVQAKTELSIKPSLRKKPSRTDAVVAYVFAAAIAGGATYAYIYQGDLEMGDKHFDQKDNIKYGAYGGWGLAGVVGLSAVYYTFRDKGPPSTGTIDVRAVALEPTVGPGYSGVSLGGRF
ncbi:MAG: PEGA domain-containing protein [Kofleriaceae bacterium]|nr:MAG: PEGA domain-containing protein [Kofleriaceae bacterium]MBZ0234563.1 PEGA domain-containing protein [Kofleriaceae bacterium]